MTRDEERARREREREWGEKLLRWILIAVIVGTLAVAALFQILW